MKRKSTLAGMLLLLACSLGAQTFTATVNQSIPDNNTVVSFPITVSGLPAVIDTNFGLEQVCVSMTHTWDSDMEVQLQAPDGTTFILFSGVGGDGDDFIGTCLEGSGTSIAQGAPPFTGTFKSMGAMGSVNNGQNPNGTWNLLCRDMAGADQGFLQTFSLTFGSNPAMPFVFASSNLPIVKLTTLANPIGNDPKVPVRMEIIDNGPGQRNYTNQTNFAYAGTIMAEWQGFSGPSYPKKNYDFETVDAQLVQLDTSILGMPTESDWIFKAEYLDHSLMKNTITYEMARRMGMEWAPRTRACEIILDGQYMGYYTLTEKPKRDANRLNIDKLDVTETSGPDLTGGYIIEMNINGDPGAWNSTYPPANNATCNFPVEYKYVYPKAGSIVTQQASYIHAFVDSFENALAGPNFDDPVVGYRKYVDISTFIDFMICNEFSVNYDSYGRSTFLYKENVTDGGLMKVGPPWDYDRAMDWTDPGRTSGWVWEITHPYWPFPFWWTKWWTEEYYRHQVYCRWTDLRATVLATSEFDDMIDSLNTLLSEAADRNFTAWPDLGNETYQLQVDSLRSYLTRRLDWIDATLDAEGFSQPTFYLPLDTTLCLGTVFDAGYNGPQFDYNWQPGPDSAFITVTQSGPLTLQVTDEWGCRARKTMDVTAVQANASFTALPQGTTGVFDFTPTDGAASSYTWHFGDGDSSSVATPAHTYNAAGNYTVTLALVDSNGCTATDSVTITVILVGTTDALSALGGVSPNPFASHIDVTLRQAVRSGGRVSLENELGQVVLQARLQPGARGLRLDTGALPHGFYILHLEADGRAATRKVVK